MIQTESEGRTEGMPGLLQIDDSDDEDNVMPGLRNIDDSDDEDDDHAEVNESKKRPEEKQGESFNDCEIPIEE